MGGGMEASYKMHAKSEGKPVPMSFDQENKVIISTLNPDEARAFCKFLDSECKRHQRDIDEARALIELVEATRL